MKLISYSSSESGGMNGSYSSTYIAYSDDGRCKVDIANRTNHSQPIKRVKYYADGLLEKLSEVCERYDIISWTDLPDQIVVMRDAPTVSECFTFENGTKIALGSGKQYPGLFHEMNQELEKFIRESESYGVDLEVIEETPFITMGMMGAQVDKPVMPINVQNASSRSEGTIKWAKFCSDCGTEFMGNQKFCAECGSARPKW